MRMRLMTLAGCPSQSSVLHQWWHGEAGDRRDTCSSSSGNQSDTGLEFCRVSEELHLSWAAHTSYSMGECWKYVLRRMATCVSWPAASSSRGEAARACGGVGCCTSPCACEPLA